jgi:hypothetical protein
VAEYRWALPESCQDAYSLWSRCDPTNLGDSLYVYDTDLDVVRVAREILQQLILLEEGNAEIDILDKDVVIERERERERERDKA